MQTLKINTIKLIFIAFCLLTTITANSQIGGTSTFQFLQLPISSKASALGGMQISLIDNDQNFIFNNPASIDTSANQSFMLSYSSIPGGIKFGSFSSAINIKKIGIISFGASYMNYGDFIASSETGQKTGTFSAADYVFHISFTKQIIDTFLNIGISLKPIYSHLEEYTSTGLAFNLGLIYNNPINLFSIGLTIKDFGTQLKTYTSGNREALPLDIQLGFTKQLAHAPFRFSMLFHHLQKWDLSYNNDQVISNIFNTDNTQSSGFGDKILRHCIIGAEFLPSKIFYIGLGYNFKRRKEMAIQEKPGLVGFSWGFGLKIYKFNISYARAAQHIAGATNYFTIASNLKQFVRKK